MIASPAQRKKVKGELCIVCEQGPCDPAHVCARAQGGCDHPDCVVPLCRRCHNAYDTRKLSLWPYLRPYRAPLLYWAEIVHALEHYAANVDAFMRRVAACGYEAEPF